MNAIFRERKRKMKEALRFVQLYEGDETLLAMAREVWVPFIREVNANDGVTQSDEAILDGLAKRIHIQGSRKDMHFELALLDGEAVGIAMFAIDLGTIGGLLDQPGYGTVMGFYIKPTFRRRGLGRAFFEHIQMALRQDGARRMYLCPDSATGVPFWRAMGFADSGKIDPDDRKPIYMRDIEA